LVLVNSPRTVRVFPPLLRRGRLPQHHLRQPRQRTKVLLTPLSLVPQLLTLLLQPLPLPLLPLPPPPQPLALLLLSRPLPLPLPLQPPLLPLLSQLDP